MNLFNIGVEGQYRVATFAAARLRRWAILPGYLNTVGRDPGGDGGRRRLGRHRRAAAGHPRRQRGHLHDHAERHRVSLVAYLLRKVGEPPGPDDRHRRDPRGHAGCRSIPLIPDAVNEFYGLALLAVVAGVAFAVVLTRTRFGFDLRATGQSESAAVASGVNVKRMVIYSMLLSGAVAGLIGMPSCSATRTSTARPSRPASASPASRSRCSGATTRSASPSAR